MKRCHAAGVADTTFTEHRVTPRCAEPSVPGGEEQHTHKEGHVNVTTEAFIYEAIRTPRGRGKKTGSLHSVKPIDLVTGLIGELRSRHPDLDEDRISDLILGVVSPVGDQGADIATHRGGGGGMPVTVGGVQINRFCASGLEAINMAAQKVRSGFDDLVLAGGVESMSRVPMGQRRRRVGHGSGHQLRHLLRAAGHRRRPHRHHRGLQPRRRRRVRGAVPGSGGQGLVGRLLRQVRRPGTDLNGLVVLDHDEHMRPGTTVESLAKLDPSFAIMGEMGGFDAVALQKYHFVEKIDHVHHGGNSSGIVDGAALVLVGSEEAARSIRSDPARADRRDRV